MKKGVLLFIIILMGWSYIVPAPGVYAANEGPFQMLTNDQRVTEEKEYTLPEQPTVYLTFDDGPSHFTPLVLDILKEEGIQATFFTLGELAERHSETVKRIAEEGHALGNHTYNHEYQILYSHFDEFWKQIQQTEEVLYQITGEKPSIIRAPGGTSTNFDAFYYYYLEEAGYQVHDWNIDSGDSKRRGVPASEIIDNIKKGPFQHEINLLLHDRHEESVKALPEIIRFFKEKGYSFAALLEEVKPIQFSLKQNKWNRTTSRGDYTATLQQINEHEHKQAAAFIKASTAPQVIKETEFAAVGVNPLEGWDPPLLVQLGERNMVLKPGLYKLESGKFHVPLRTLMEQLGGEVEWNAKRHIATIRYKQKTIEYHMNTQMMKILSPFERTKTIHKGEFAIQNGSTLVPLESTLKLLNIQMGSSTAHEIKREVKAYL